MKEDEGEPTLEEVIIKLLDKYTSESKSIKLEDDLMHDIGLGSLDKVEAVMEFEDKFNHEVPDNDFVSWRTVQDIIDYAIEHNLRVDK